MNESELPPETPNPEGEKERRINALRAELLHYLQLLTRQAVSPGELEWQMEYVTDDGREIIVSYVKNPPENATSEDSLATVVITDRDLPDGKERHTTFEYKVAAPVERHVVTVSRREREEDVVTRAKKVISQMTKEHRALGEEQKPSTVASEGDLKLLNLMLRRLAARERLEE